jgi:hypothetical protein
MIVAVCVMVIAKSVPVSESEGCVGKSPVGTARRREWNGENFKERIILYRWSAFIYLIVNETQPLSGGQIDFS